MLVRRDQRQWVDFTKFDETVPLGEQGSVDQQEVSQRLAQHTISEHHMLACRLFASARLIAWHAAGTQGSLMGGGSTAAHGAL